MNSKDVNKIFKELNKDNILQCTQKELDSFLMAGLIFKSGKTYLTRDQSVINIDLIKEKCLTFDIDLSDLIQQCIKFNKEVPTNKIYCMTTTCYNRYKELGLIITKDAKEYYRLYDKELWQIYLV